eukprot:scaffold17809_cov59-Phaeocystis_antarctica.AAC.1
MPSTGNNCLLHSISYNGDPRGSDKSDAYMRELREAIATTAIAYRDYDFNGKTLEGWVWATAGMDLDSWAADFVANDTMSDQLVLRIWPLFRGEAVWVWQPSRAGGYEHHAVYRFGAPTGKQARHVVYRPAQLHYNALQVIRPAALERPVVSITPTARPRWVQQQSHRAAEQQKPPPLTVTNCDEARVPLRSTYLVPYIPRHLKFASLARTGHSCGQVDGGRGHRRDSASPAPQRLVEYVILGYPAHL